MDATSADRSFLETAEERLLEHATRRRQVGRTDVIFAVVRSTAGNVYDGIPLETSAPQLDHCAERHAINAMRQAEPGDPGLDAILVAGPVPDESSSVTTPCGACRHVIDEFSDDGTVYCSSYVREPDGWTVFPTVERYTATGLYPDHHPHPTWD